MRTKAEHRIMCWMLKRGQQSVLRQALDDKEVELMLQEKHIGKYLVIPLERK